MGFVSGFNVWTGVAAAPCFLLGGLAAASDLDLPECEQRLPSQSGEDFRIVLGRVPEGLDAPTFSSPALQWAAPRLLLRIPGVARFLVTAGTEIRVQPLPGADPRDVRLFLLGSAFGALCHQLGRFPLHASAVRVGDGCVAFVGDSGAGKSTLAAFLQARGHALLSDDVCVLTRTGDATVMAHPGPPRVKLWIDAVQALGVEPASLVRDRTRMDKYQLSSETGLRREALPLRGVYILGARTDVRVSPLGGLAALATLSQNTYRRGLVDAMGVQERHFRACAAVAAEVPVYTLDRPLGFDSMGLVLDRLETHWASVRASSTRPDGLR